MREAYIVRAALEELSGRLAAPHFKENVARLVELAGEIRHAAKLDDISGYVKSDVAFHRTIVEGTNNKVLLRSWDALGFEVRMQIRLANRSLNLALTQKEHWPIIEALREGAGRKAGKLLQQHVFNFAKL